jgi:hypothetical protein
LISGKSGDTERVCVESDANKKETEILGVNKLGSKIWNIDIYMNFYISKLARLVVYYHYAVYA